MNIDAHIAELKRIDEEFQVWLKQKSYYGPPKFIFELYEDFAKDTGNHFIPVELRNYQFDPVVYKQKLLRYEKIDKNRDFLNRPVDIGDIVYCQTKIGFKKTYAAIKVTSQTPAGKYKGVVLESVWFGKDPKKNEMDRERIIPYDFVIITDIVGDKYQNT